MEAIGQFQPWLVWNCDGMMKSLIHVQQGAIPTYTIKYVYIYIYTYMYMTYDICIYIQYMYIYLYTISHHITSHHVISYHLISHHIISHHITSYQTYHINLCTSCFCCILGLSFSLCFFLPLVAVLKGTLTLIQVTPRTPERRKARIYCNIWAKGSAATDLSWNKACNHWFWCDLKHTFNHSFHLCLLMFTSPVVFMRPKKQGFESVWQFPETSCHDDYR